MITSHSEDVPTEIVVQEDSGPRRFLCDRDNNRRIRFSEKETLLAPPFEFMTDEQNEKRPQFRQTKIILYNVGVCHSLFPFERPSEH
jgi:hypothetical protein